MEAEALGIRPPGDKSITHRALILAALADGTTVIRGALTALDARSMAGALRRLGVAVSPLREGRVVTVEGRGVRGLQRPGVSLHCGNSGTTARFLLGVLAGHPFEARITGDASLRRRPMRRVTVPLSLMGAQFEYQNEDGLPVVVRGARLRPLEYRMPVAAAQVKSALLLAGICGQVPVALEEPARSRDHTERLLRSLGAAIQMDGLKIRLNPPSRLPAFEIEIPGDFSSAAFLIAAGLLKSRGEIFLDHVGLNPTRTGLLRVLGRMGASVEVLDRGYQMGEPVGDLVVRPSSLVGCEVGPQEVPSLIDELPVLAVLASRAQGESVFRGVGELRVKESDRLSLLARNLRALGVEAEAEGDTLTVVGTDRPPRGRVETAGDHRLAMAFAVLAGLPGAQVELSEWESPGISYPRFFADLERVRSFV
ncbi:MAG: 3-phosphoshikimate 1-carboxyvinyltransferase [Gemmatimonadales bacterium]|nr:3-phosphoshikimate 1-carboxyvinyltransferase 1 [bacterium HR33]GIW50795.1 MAG: 3-phosphoshikimate 1-carboxyvinyltransferase [Gemmatimonadales bacterium]